MSTGVTRFDRFAPFPPLRHLHCYPQEFCYFSQVLMLVRSLGTPHRFSCGSAARRLSGDWIHVTENKPLACHLHPRPWYSECGAMSLCESPAA